MYEIFFSFFVVFYLFVLYVVKYIGNKRVVYYSNYWNVELFEIRLKYIEVVKLIEI